LGCLNVKISCDDGDACTIDGCHCDEGCQHFPVDVRDFPQCKGHDEEVCTSNADCEDSSACTIDTCTGGKCHKVAVDCDDHDLCTIDSCHHTEGCQHAPIYGPTCGNGDDEDDHMDKMEIMDMKEETQTEEIHTQNTSEGHADSVLTAGPIAGIVAGVVALVAVLGFIGYKVTQKPATVNDNAYASM
jgi:hypothetical protein